MTVNILLATYNGEKFLQDQLASIVNQSYTEWRLYISDDGSTDATNDIIQNFQNKYCDKVFVLKNAIPFKNAKDNFINLVNRTDGDLFLFCDQDDVWQEDKLYNMISKYQSLPDYNKKRPVLMHSDLIVVDAELKIIAPSFMKFANINPCFNYPKSYLIQNNVTGCTMLINDVLRDLFVACLNKCKSLQKDIIMHDWFFALIAAYFGEVHFVNTKDIFYRQHGSNVVGAKNARSIKLLIKHFFKFKENIISMEEVFKQAYVFLKMFEDLLSESDALLLVKFSKLNTHCKIYRIMFIIKNKLWKNGVYRKLAQILFI